jgi:acyl-coenzyme A synthetase/AMP-(fatty) acid ligase
MERSDALPVLFPRSPDRPLAWWRGKPIGAPSFLYHVRRTARSLPAHRYVLNLCEDRYCFMVAFTAAMMRGQTNLLPPGSTPQTLAEVAKAYGDCHCITDRRLQDVPLAQHVVDIHELVSGHESAPPVMISGEHVGAIVFTSGSTGRVQPNPKTWHSLVAGARLSQQRFAIPGRRISSVVATVPPQHMYGLETSIVMPLVTGMGVYGGRPFFPADLQAALASVPAPRTLITTPVHLKSCVHSNLQWPEVEFLISATAPLARELARQAEQDFAAPVFEIYGSTETGAVASRRTVADSLWTPYEGVTVKADDHGILVSGPQLPHAAHVPDVISSRVEGQFELLGRDVDLVKIAGRRTSLSDLNHKLNAIEGVEDGVFVVPPGDDHRVVRRLTALVVAPALDERQILAALAQRVDRVFLPRPLRKVAHVPRSDVGKLSRDQLQALMEQTRHFL